MQADPSGDTPSQLLRRTGRALHSETVSIDEALQALSVGGFGLVLAALATPNLLPSPGLPIGLVLGVPLLLLAGQYALGYERPRIPGWVGRRQRARRYVGRALRWLAPRVRWWERRVGRRPLGWPAAVGRVVIGCWVMLMAILIILPIPFGNSLPALSSVLISAGQFLDDRLSVALGFGAGLGALIYAAAIGVGAWEAFKYATG